MPLDLNEKKISEPINLNFDKEKKKIIRMLETINSIFMIFCSNENNAYLKSDRNEKDYFVPFCIQKEFSDKYCQLINSVPEGINYCRESNKELIKIMEESGQTCFHYCHAGLVDFAFPLVVGDRIIPVVCGQTLFEPYSDEEIEKIITNVSGKISVNKELLRKALKKVPVVPLDILKDVFALFSVLFENLSSKEVVKVLSSIGKFASKSKHNKLYKAINFLKENYKTPLNIDGVAKKISISPSHLNHLFKKHTGLSPSSYRENLRLETAKKLLNDTKMSVTEIAFSLGWNSSNYFSDVFKRKTGFSPLLYRGNSKKESFENSKTKRYRTGSNYADKSVL
jgi:AraC-like DNA-binding protein/ligand-binding sensor protein